MNRMAPIAVALLAAAGVVTALSAVAAVIVAGLGLGWQIMVSVAAVSAKPQTDDDLPDVRTIR